MFAKYMAFVDEHRIEPVIDKTFKGLENAKAAFELMGSGGHFGKIVIER